MNYLSVCSGIEAATVAWHPLGWSPVAFSEIEKFPRAVLKHHYPDVPLFGDFTEIQNDELAKPVDLLVGGTPCQSFSVAGLRGGMDDDRGNLALEFCRLALRTRPRWIVWENVPGVLSSWSDDPDCKPEQQNDGTWNVRQRNDFDCFLKGLEECGYGVAYRVLDAQYCRVQSHPFAVPQRRRRVFVVGYLGDWRRTAQVLFERESLQRNSPPRRESGKGFAAEVARCLDSSGPRNGSRIGDRRGQDNVVAARMVAFGQYSTDGSASKLKERDYKDATDLIAFSCKDSGADASEISPTLRSMNHGNSHQNGGGQVAIAFDTTQITNSTNRSNPSVEHCHALSKGQHTPAVFGFENRARGDDGRGEVREPSFSEGVSPTISMAKAPSVVGPGVRRLTPLECERLQGFPDRYTDVDYRGKPACDGPRYKAIGNSMAVNVMSWIGQRIQQVERSK